MTERKSLPLFAALDLNTLREARQTMDMLSGVVDAIKIGPRLYAQGGAHFLKEIVGVFVRIHKAADMPV